MHDICLPMVALHLMSTAKCLGTFLCHLLQRCPASVQILDLDTNLLRSLGLTHCRQALGNCIQLHQTSLVCLQILSCTYSHVVILWIHENTRDDRSHTTVPDGCLFMTTAPAGIYEIHCTDYGWHLANTTKQKFLRSFQRLNTYVITHLSVDMRLQSMWKI